MSKININNKEIEFEKGKTLIQVCDDNNIEIPRFCYHEKLNIAGNCRMCLVEVEGARKPVASCAAEAREGMVVKTESKLVKDAREGVMEFLLINHPLDCPICDQGGECDLQDQAMLYGKGESSFEENKRAVKDKDFGPLISTHMTRCIHCSRCVRFSEEVAGVPELGIVGRGEHAEITTALNSLVTSEISGNVIDLCPVGALTSKPYEFKARSWELKKTYSVDVFDAVGSNIRIDSRGSEVLRVVPNRNDEINEEWITDKVRFSYDGLKYNRIDAPYIRVNGKLVKASWDEAISHASKIIKSTKNTDMAAIAGGTVDNETLYAAKNFLDCLKVSNIDVLDGDIKVDSKNPGSYLFNSTIQNIEKSDLHILIGTNLRREAPLIDLRVRRAANSKKTSVYTIGCAENQTYKSSSLDAKKFDLKALFSPTGALAKQLKKSERPSIVIGYGLLKRKDAPALMSQLYELAMKHGVVTDKWNGFNIVHKNASIVGAIQIGFKSADKTMNFDEILDSFKRNVVKTLLIFNCDEFNENKLKAAGSVIYFGHHGDRAANYADVIFPVPSFTEREGSYTNLEGKVQKARMAVAPKGEAQEEYNILLKLSSALGLSLSYKNKETLSSLTNDLIEKVKKTKNTKKVIFDKLDLKKIKIDSDAPITPDKIDFYMDNPICRSSRTMLECKKKLMS